MPEQPALLRLSEGRTASELPNTPDVVQERSGEQEVVPEARVELSGLAAERRDADRVLEEPACVAMVAVGPGRREGAERGSDLLIANERADGRSDALVRDLRREELVEPVELVGIASQRRCELRRISVLRRLDGPHLDLQSPSETLHASEHVHRVPLAEALVEELHVVPDSRLHPSARVGELERQIGGTVAGPATLLLRDREHALDGPVLGELGDRRHAASL